MIENRDLELKEVRENLANKIKESRKQLAKEIVFVSQQIDEIVKGFSNSKNVLITYKDLSLFEIGQRIEVSEDVTFEKIYQDDNRMTFMTYIMDGGGYGVHSHDCYEITTVLKGNLIERNYGMKVYSEGDTVVYSPKEVHKPYATKDSTYEVTFCKHLFK